MIKEYNYYITTNRFSQIAEELETTVRSYAENIGKKDENELREKARSLCSSHLVSSGLRSKENSFINIDAEFFDGGELIEANLNRFIKDVLKAHGYQKVLWEYMGTTGMMTEISKSAMKIDGFNYENYLPAGLKEKEAAKGKIKLNRNFNRLQDDSGFDWSRGYDPNDTIEKKGWFSDYDENGVWTRYVTNGENENTEKLNSSEKIFKIKLIKTEKGCMLYDPGMILLNPILLWYLTQDDEVYGAEESDTIELVQTIKEQLVELKNEKITEVSFGSLKNKNTKEIEVLCKKYKAILRDAAENKLTAVDSKKAEILAEENIRQEKNLVIEKKSAELQKKIAVILKAKPDAKSEEITSVLETGKTEIALDILEETDAKLAGFSTEEYESFIAKAAELPSAKRVTFAKAAAVISKNWNEYKTCGKTKEECISLIYEYVKEGKESDFNYELSLKQVLEEDISSTSENAEELISYDIKTVEKIIKEKLPQENQGVALEYVASLPEQPDVVKTQVYKKLSAAVKNYLTVRMSTGMSIKELFDYAVKTSGGKLPKASFTPPVVGYISSAGTNATSAKDSTGEKRIYFEGKVSTLFEELINKNAPQKEVSLNVLEGAYEKSVSKKNRKSVKIGFKNSEGVKDSDEEITETSASYDTGDEKTINPLILAVLKMLYVSEPESRKKIVEIAKVSESREDFIRAVSKDFNVQYYFADESARELYTEQNKTVSRELLEDYAQDFEDEAEKLVANENYVSSKNIQIEPVFRQISQKEIEQSESETNGEEKLQNKVALPSGYKLMKEKSSIGGVLEKITRVSARLYKDSSVSEIKPVTKRAESPDETFFSEEEKETVKLLIAEMNEGEKEELVYAAGENWNNVTPFLIREFLWRKQNGRSVKNLSEEIKVYEKLAELPKNELEKYLTSSAVNGNEKTVSFDSQMMSFTAVETAEVTGITENNKALVEDQDNSFVPVIKLTQEEKEVLQKKYGIKAESLSPVIKEYIKSGEWKKETSETTWIEKSVNPSVSGKTAITESAESKKLVNGEAGLKREKDSEISHNQKSESSQNKKNLYKSEQKKTVQLLLDEMPEKERKEMLASFGSDQSTITPLLIKEYLWRKKNKKGIKKLSSEVAAFEKLSTIPQHELEKFLTSTAVNGSVKKVSFDRNSLSFNTSSLNTAAVNQNPTYNIVSGIKTSSVTATQEPISATTSAATTNIPVVKLTAEEKHHYSQTYGLPTEGLSPVVQSYIKSGAWKKTSGAARVNETFNSSTSFSTESFAQSEGFFTNESGSMLSSLTNGSMSHSSTLNVKGSTKQHTELPHSAIQTHTAKQDASANGSNTAWQDSITGSSSDEVSNVTQISPISDTLKESLTHLAEQRHAKKQQSYEMTKLDRINSNYEHDKAVLAKNDPLFAKNQFWDVGHAEGNGEMTNSEMVKAASRTNNETKINLLGGI